MRADLLTKISNTISGYKGFSEPKGPEHVEKWARQFDEHSHDWILWEMAHVLENWYVTEGSYRGYISEILNSKNLTKNDPEFWKRCKFLHLREAESSQGTLLRLMDEQLKKEFKLTIAECGTESGPFVYVDDISYTGQQIKWGIINWAKTSECPANAEVIVITLGCHTSGRYYADREIKKDKNFQEKKMKLSWFTARVVEDSPRYRDNSEVLLPVSAPSDEHVQAYIKSLSHPISYRTPNKMEKNNVFDCEEGRHCLEQCFLIKGAQIIAACSSPKKTMRPLGYRALESLGFGSLYATFRNCPNNAPLVLWWGLNWYPLLPRVTKQSSAAEDFADVSLDDFWDN